MGMGGRMSSSTHDPLHLRVFKGETGRTGKLAGTFKQARACLRNHIFCRAAAY